MEIAVRLKTKDEIAQLIQLGADIMMLDTDDLTAKAIMPLSKDRFAQIHHEIKKHKKKTYIWINKMIHEPDLKRLDNWLSLIKNLDIDGIVINDFTVFVAAKKYHINNKVIYQPGTMNTNRYDAYYLKDRIKGMSLSKEITLDEIKNIMSETNQIEYSIVAHGFLDMFYSKRRLITNYLIHKAIPMDNVKNNHHYHIEEKTRKDIFFPILEDQMGTHIFRDRKLESFTEVNQIESKLSTIFLERIFMEDDEYYAALEAYKHPEKAPMFIENYGGSYHHGFYYTPTEKTKGEKHEN